MKHWGVLSAVVASIGAIIAFTSGEGGSLPILFILVAVFSLLAVVLSRNNKGAP